VKYQCCHGFRRVEGKPGCTEGNSNENLLKLKPPVVKKP
jgi:hypothetical protein